MSDMHGQPAPEPQTPVPPYLAGAPGQAETSYPQPAAVGYPPAGPPVNAYGAPMAVAPKNPGVALIASFFIPGLGSMINGEVGKGIGILIGYLISAVLVIVVIGIFGVVGFWVWGMVDAYQGAKQWNLRHGIYS